MSLKGNLNTIELTDLLQLLCNDHKTGVLEITNENNEVKVFIQDGSIIYATSSQKEFRLGTLMVNEGIITGKQLMNAIVASREKNISIGKFLVMEQQISPDALKQFTNKQVEEILYDIFLWGEGSFEYQDQTLDLEKMIIVHFNTMNIMLEAARRIDDMSIFKKTINNATMVFYITEKILDNKGIVLKSNEWRMLSFINGIRSVKEIIKKSGFDNYSAYNILHSLIAYGLLKEDSGGQAAQKETAVFSTIAGEYCNILQAVKSHFKAAR